MEVKFSNKASSDKKLYINASDISGWNGYLYSGNDAMSEELSLQETWNASENKSAYIFCRYSPKDMEDFTQKLSTYLSTLPDARLYCLWIQDTEAQFDAQNIQKLSISTDNRTSKCYIDQHTYFLAGSFIRLSILRFCRIALNQEKNRIEITRDPYGLADITFYNDAFRSRPLVGDVLSVPFHGKLAGCLCFPLTVRGSNGLNDYKLGLKYNDGSINLKYCDESIHPTYEYTLFSGSYNSNICMQISIDLLDQYNEESQRTYFAFTEQQDPMPSCFRSIYGEKIWLKPRTEYLSDDEFSVSDNSAKIVFQQWEKENVKNDDNVYTVLQGDFYLRKEDSADRKSEEPETVRILCGLSGLEYIEGVVGNDNKEGDCLCFVPNSPAEYRQEASLGNRYQTAWIGAFAPEGTGREVCYISQPEEAALYGPEAKQDKILAYMPCKTASLTKQQSFPMVCYGEAAKVEEEFEKNVLMQARNTEICNNVQVINQLKNSSTSWSVTPQGLLVKVEKETGQWMELLLGTGQYLGTKKRLEFLPCSGEKFIQPYLKNAFQSTSMFLVVSQNENNVLGNFLNEINIEDWNFTFNVPEKSSYGNFKNILIFKFCPGKIQDLVKNTGKWTYPDRFNNGETLPILSQWIVDYIETGVNNYQENHDENFADFAEIVQNENYQGILVLKADISIRSFPTELKGLLGGIDLSGFNAHHFGINVNRVDLDTDGTLVMNRDSSMFGLVHYTDTDFENVHCDVDRYREEKKSNTSADYDFRVLSLDVLFRNSKISSFGSIICLTVNKMFQSSVDISQVDNKCILRGSLERQGETASYVFQNIGTNRMSLVDSILSSIDIIKTDFQTTSDGESSDEIVSCFSFSGYMGFKELDFDVFSYESTAGSGLAFSNLVIQMKFTLDHTDDKNYLFCPEMMSFDSSRSSVREGSLANHFPLTFDTVLCGSRDKALSESGYVIIGTPDIQNTGIGNDWYGLNFKLDMGTLGELASESGFEAELLVAWQKERAAVAIKLPGITEKSKTFSLDGVLKLEIEKIKLVRAVSQEGKPAYLLMMNQICLRLLGMEFPKDASIDFYIFGNPDQKEKSTELSWYAAYQEKDKG